MPRMTQETRVVVLVLFASTILFAADKNRREPIPAAPLPQAIVEAKKAFLAKGAGGDRAIRDGDDLAFDTFYAEMKRWGRFELVDAPEKADVIMELSYASEPAHGRARDPRLTLTFSDAKSGTRLWADSQGRRKAFCRSNREKNLRHAVAELVAKLKGQMERQ